MGEVVVRKFKKFSKIVSNLCEWANVPQYFRYVQKKTYTDIQHLFLLVAKEESKMTYKKIRWV